MGVCSSVNSSSHKRVIITTSIIVVTLTMLFILNVRDPATNSLDVRDKVVDDNSHNDGVSLDNMPINETEPSSTSIHLNNHNHSRSHSNNHNHIHNHNHSNSFHYNNWQSLREVDGLLNEDNVLTSTGKDCARGFFL